MRPTEGLIEYEVLKYLTLGTKSSGTRGLMGGGMRANGSRCVSICTFVLGKPYKSTNPDAAVAGRAAWTRKLCVAEWRLLSRGV
jgi:hypothetical protein